MTQHLTRQVTHQGVHRRCWHANVWKVEKGDLVIGGEEAVREFARAPGVPGWWVGGVRAWLGRKGPGGWAGEVRVARRANGTGWQLKDWARRC